jgi:hypothetical protein
MIVQPYSFPRFEREVRATENRVLMAPTQALSSKGTDPGQRAHMLLVLRSKRGVFAMQLVELLVSDSGASAMRKLRERSNHEGALKSKVRLAVLCKRMSVDIAEINLVSDNLHTWFILGLMPSTVADA